MTGGEGPTLSIINTWMQQDTQDLHSLMLEAHRNMDAIQAYTTSCTAHTSRSLEGLFATKSYVHVEPKSSSWANLIIDTHS